MLTKHEVQASVIWIVFKKNFVLILNCVYPSQSYKAGKALKPTRIWPYFDAVQCLIPAVKAKNSLRFHLKLMMNQSATISQVTV